MREEWRDREPTIVRVDNPASSWDHGHLVRTAVLMAVAGLVLSIGLARILRPGPAGVAAAEAGEPDVETAIGEARAAVREGTETPAGSDHLAVVQVSVSACGGRSTGSGVVVGHDLMLTAAHVIGDAGLVRIDHGTTTVTGEVLGVLGDERDIALVELDAPMEVPARFAAVPATGEPITLVGYPDAGPRTSFVGPRADIAPQVAALAGSGEIVGVDVGIDEGISGGPALAEDGAIVGLVIAKETATDTALVVAIEDLAELRDVPLVPGTCEASA